jgi:AcrR family transcriptional regulator
LIITTVRAIVKAMQENSLDQKPSGNEISTPKGRDTRAVILHTAAKLATTRGLRSLSIGDLASEVGMSKSGLYAHFSSKEELELATIETAVEIFDVEVLEAIRQAPPGITQLRAMVDSFLLHLERRVFPGGCFFTAVAMELDSRPGRARDRVMEIQQKWMGLLKQCLLDAHAQGEIPAAAEVDQAVFEIEALLLGANFMFVLTGSTTFLTSARQGAENVLARLGVKTGRKKKAT